MTYYNTTHKYGEELRDAILKTESQDAIILRYFLTYPAAWVTPHDVHKNVLKDSPLTSVRRSITNLTDSGFLKKTKFKKIGAYGQLNYCWRLNSDFLKPKGQMELF